MTKAYKQLTYKQRQQIYILNESGNSAMAKILGLEVNFNALLATFGSEDGSKHVMKVVVCV